MDRRTHQLHHFPDCRVHVSDTGYQKRLPGVLADACSSFPYPSMSTSLCSPHGIHYCMYISSPTSNLTVELSLSILSTSTSDVEVKSSLPPHASPPHLSDQLSPSPGKDCSPRGSSWVSELEPRMPLCLSSLPSWPLPGSEEH
jgi:hypothetical protein